ncbi:hypothetical protein EG68_00896 [Paragonimus skrjabini miyazakii]|uniref:Uncharacterized protein n=1 Tax=Paragonimus skrjabini miyazakii TaxID=59628 RepID=A0A8S9ZCE0_9TREM|nr:hypothetical protein EG68_00896 [Paragonimus skrjabini miyazakii]
MRNSTLRSMNSLARTLRSSNGKHAYMLVDQCTQMPAIKLPPSFDSDTNLPLWRRKVDLYLANIPTDYQGSYILSLLSDNVQEVLWASDLSTTATATAIWSKLEELYPVPDNRAESRTTFWSRRQLLGETVEDYANQLRVLVARAFPDAPKETKDLLVFERFLEGIGDLPTRRRFIQEPPIDLSCAIRLARSYAKSAELVPERDENCYYLLRMSKHLIQARRRDTDLLAGSTGAPSLE